MRLQVDQENLRRIFDRLTDRDPTVGEDARAALEWLTAGEEDDVAAAFSRRRLQLFLWYELPRKWLIEPDEHLAVAAALGLFFDELGAKATSLAALCRDPETETARLLREGGDGFVEALEASGRAAGYAAARMERSDDHRGVARARRGRRDARRGG